MPPVTYFIRTKTRGDIFRILEILFSHGYVFGAHERIKTIKGFEKGYGYATLSGWNWLVIGDDSECKMVINVYGFRFQIR